MVQRIFELMEKNNITATELAKATGIGTSPISQWRKGLQKPSTDAITKLAKYFEVSADYLLGLTNTPTPIPLDTAALLEENTQLKEQLLIKDKQLAVIQAALKNE